MVENRDKSGSRGKRTQRFYAWVQTRSLRTCTGLLSILTLAARGLSSFGEDHNTQSGRLIVSKGLSSSNFNSEAYVPNFADKDGNVRHGEGGQNLPPEAPHLGCDNLRYRPSAQATNETSSRCSSLGFFTNGGF